jgi:hypothetical protein
MFIMVLYFFLLAGLLFLVINSGDQLNRKVTMQTAADSTAFTGAAWFCRGMNAIAMSNVADTQLLSMIIMLDTLETVVPPSTQCIDDLLGTIGSAAAHHDIPIDPRISDWLAVGNAESERQIIHEFYNVVRNIQMNDYCAYDNGVLWECVKLMDGFSHAMLRFTPLAAQREAMDVARKNHAEFGFLVPLWPELPGRSGTFSDFHDPMAFATMPPPQKGKVIAGFATLWHYQSYNGKTVGPWGYWRDPFTNGMPMGLFDISRFSTLFNLVSVRKLEMLFGSTDDRVSLHNWEMDYDKAKGLDEDTLRRVWWESTGFDCRYEFPKNEFFASTALRYEQKPHVYLHCFAERKYWFSQDPALNRNFGITWHRLGWPDLTSVAANGERWVRAKEAWEGADPRLAVWYRVEQRKTAHYPQIGIFAPHPPYHMDRTPWPYTEAELTPYYHVSFWRFDGAELEEDTPLHRRYLPPAGTTPPFSPIMLDPSAAVITQAGMMRWYTFNAFAYRPGAVRDWAERFVNPNPIPKTLAYAEAHVYNRMSYDLFTQYWQAKMTRQDRWKALLGELGKGLPADGAPLADELTQERFKPVVDMINGYDEEFVREVSH